MRAEWRLPLAVTALGALAAGVLGSPSLPMSLRALAAAALAFLLPGAALLVALLPRVRLYRSEGLALALGGSLTTAIGSAFLLHALPSGLSAGSWAAMLGGVAVVGGLMGWLRVLPRPATDPTATDAAAGWVAGPPEAAAARMLVSPWSIAMLAAAGVVVALALTVSRSGLALGPSASFSELWLLPIDGDRAVRVGVTNHEGSPQDYQLIITVDGRRLGDPVAITLADGGTTDALVPLPDGPTGARTVEARLWHADQSPSDPPQRLVRAVVQADEVGP